MKILSCENNGSYCEQAGGLSLLYHHRVSDILVFPGSHIIAIEIEMFHLLQLCIFFYMQCISFSGQAEMQQKTAACSMGKKSSKCQSYDIMHEDSVCFIKQQQQQHL